MSRYKCDLHIHSCLSPCGDNDMTPGNIVGMAMLNGLDIVALTDHNTSKNCPAFFEIAKKHGIIAVAGMELTTSEDVHVVCLFRSLESAMEFDRFVDGKRFKIKNEAEIFGHQYIVDENDEVVGEEESLLINATMLSLSEAYNEVLTRGGVCLPAHIDRDANGMISMLGDFPPEPLFTAFELNDGLNLDAYQKMFPIIKDRELLYVVSSDAHYLTDISEDGFAVELDAMGANEDVTDRLIDYLLKKNR